MNNSNLSDTSRSIIDAGIVIIAGMILGIACFDIIRPFILPIAWGAIIAIALYPLFNKLKTSLGGKGGLAAAILTIIGISALVIPTVTFSSSAIDAIGSVGEQLKEGTLDVPPPSEKVKEWPLIGEKTYTAWEKAATNIEGFASQYSEQIKNTFSAMLGAAASFGGVILQFVFSMIITAIFWTNAEACNRGCQIFFSRLMGDKSDEILKNSVATVRSVGAGILGIAFTQAILAGIGLVVAGIPAAGIWVLLVLIVAIVQLPPILILGPIAAYYFSVADTTPAVIFLIYSFLVSMSDAFLKPLLLGRGTDIPMLVILMGAIGGMIMSGIIGLFTGAVILALGYQVMLMWLNSRQTKPQESAEE
ncbi:AI-2E family transporter [Thalassotalea sp. Y01]|uniref:AI-2E family transporter n=1 Tax=Thalassotalea sp. Y01 TaxID=2729613 RepID=UPI00145E05DF|nr:AI-2E family transporter [Thalassotalea sp. Y01]NMP15807.1 AI-2E family transporter [Thalassotalea sp. Y01]